MKVLVIAAILVAAPSLTLAQDVRGGVGRSGTAQQRNDAYAMQEAYGQAMRTHALDEQQDGYRDTQNPRRIRRAEEAAKLINDGDCPAAHALAMRANDRNLAIRVEQACAHTGTPIPVEQRVPAAD